jgi:hypothetical protein
MRRSKSPETTKLQMLEKLMLCAEQTPFAILYRALIGFSLMPLFSFLYGDSGTFRNLVPLFIGILFMLKLVPLILRRLIPSPQAVQIVWAKQRQLAKRYDCYQWQKLFWIGLGMSAYLVFWSKAHGAFMFLTLFCLVTGGLALLLWRRVRITNCHQKTALSK